MFAIALTSFIFGFLEIKMFDALLKPKFYTKCKSCLKLIKMRLDRILKRRNAVQKFLKKDIADLLRSALDYNAYERAEGLLIEQNISSCYEIVAKFASCISGHVQNLCKKRDCPAECKEAIQSLIYAAARFSDLPELRELRTLFTGEYGNSLEPYISKEFVNKLRHDPPSKEMKIQLLRDLAQDFSIEWDSKALEQRLNSPFQLHQAKNDHDDHKNNDEAVHRVTESKQRDGRDCRTCNGNENDTLSQGRKGITDTYWRLQNSIDNETTTTTTTTDNSSLDGYKACPNSLASVLEYEAEIKRPFSYKLVPPPYVKEKLNKSESKLKKETESQALPMDNESNHGLHKPVVLNKPIPRSVRRRPLKSPSDNNYVSYSKTGGSAKVSWENESEKAEQHQPTKGDSRDDEERIMDRLLIHYSIK